MNPNTRKPLLGCIADDFTGATDLANNLVRSGMRTVQTIGVPTDVTSIDADAIVVALKSRNIAASAAVVQSLHAYEWLKAQGVEQFYFKYCSTFDSTPEGNIGPVAEALMDAIHGQGKGFTIVCPAFPENHRTIFKGHLFVGDVLLSDSGMKHHPLTPMTDANLVRVMQAQTKRKVGLVEHAHVAAGVHAVGSHFSALQKDGVGIAVIDALSNDDLFTIGRALANMPLVTAGSGVAIGLPANWKTQGLISDNVSADTLAPAKGFQAVLSGSCSLATNAQVLHWRESGRPAFTIDPLAAAAGADVVQQALSWVSPLLAKGPVLIYATAEPQLVKTIQNQLGVAQAGELVEHLLSQIAKGLMQAGVRQLVVAGGETSGAVVQALDVKRMLIGPQIDPGVPWTTVSSSVCNDETVHIALKSGNFGGPDFFAKAFSLLKSA
jgi:3-dehydrotetronate 4-kinase